MPITQKHVIMCDDVRREDNGKFIIIGMYTPDLAVPQIPFIMPTISFFAWLESDRPGSFPFRMRLENLESGQALTEGMGMMQFAQQGVGVTLIRFGGVQFTRPGAHVFSISVEGQSERLLTQFSVILAIPQQPMGGQPRPHGQL